jgi:hypothetical protein
MQRYGMSAFADEFAKAAADSSYSSYAKLQGTSQYDIRAAAEALWQRLVHQGEDMEQAGRSLTEDDVIAALLAQDEHYSDDNHLVSVNYEGYWDMTDGVIESPGLRRQIQEHLSSIYQRDKKAQGFTVVNNRYGIWLFRFED